MTRAYRLSALLAMSLAAFTPAASAADWYVATNGTGDGTSWANATNSIQGAINASATADTVWVSNGVYEVGGIKGYPSGSSLTNRVAIYKAITVRSANNDPTNTIIMGAWHPVTTNGPAAVRCVYMTNGSALIGFTLTNGATMTTGTDDEYGGGVWAQSSNTMISNCVLTGNSSYWVGGGAYSSTLYNCALTRNSSTFGGGAGYSPMFNCTLVSNSASSGGGGMYGGTLTNCALTGNSAVNYGGGTYNSTLFNCTLTGNSSPASGGGAQYGALYNCTLTGNSASSGGGTRFSTLNNCTLTGNSGTSGGGAMNAILYNCTLTNNSAVSYGGGANGGTLSNCTLTGNSAANTWGGGVYTSTLFNCTIVGNSASIGGGAYGGALYNCLLIGNSAVGLGGNLGGGACVGAMYNCTIVGNSASISGGGVYGGTLYNSIIYFNTAPSGSNWYGTVSFTNSCTTTAQVGWVSGNITNDPLFVLNGSGYGSGHVAGNYRLRSNSPSRNAGTNFSWMTDPADARSKDLDLRPRISDGQVDMGCYELMSAGTMFTVF